MITVLSHNITSPLGTTTAANYEAVLSGRTSIRQWHEEKGVPGDFYASLFSSSDYKELSDNGFSRLEQMALSSIRKAIAEANIDVKDSRTLLILTTTKGNVEWLGNEEHPIERTLPSSSAQTIAKELGITATPIVVDNACISGLSAIITACRMLEMGLYDNAIVCGAESQSKFIISGFQSLKAMSPQPCRPFDIERNGLNLGEAAATLILSRKTKPGKEWRIINGCTRNDAFHLSAPSKNGEGARQALTRCTINANKDDIAFISTHGTATLFNDQMESVAIERAGLNSIPVVGYKGYYGHTMGACGVLETALSMYCIDNNIIPATKGFSEIGVSGKIHVTTENEPTIKKSFIKMLSGFGGCNATILASKGSYDTSNEQYKPVKTKATHHIHITNNLIEVDGSTLQVQTTGKPMLTELYKSHVGNYPKFYKMDLLSRLGFIATELLLSAEDKERFTEANDRAVILVGHHGSLLADINYLQSIKNPNDYFPSPERFVYTLPNIVTGEIAIRNKYHGETGFYLLDERNDEVINNIISTAFIDSKTKSVIGGWIDCTDNDNFEADLNIIERI